MALFQRPLPNNDVLIVLKGEHAGKATDEFTKWAEGLERQSAASPVAPEPAAQLENISVSTSGTLGGDIPSGLYVIYAYREVVIADPVSSSLQIAIGWTHNGKSLTRTLSAFGGAPQTVNDTASDVTVIETDPNTAISFTITYASNTPLLARFQASLIANLLQTLS